MEQKAKRKRYERKEKKKMGKGKCTQRKGREQKPTSPIPGAHLAPSGQESPIAFADKNEAQAREDCA